MELPMEIPKYLAFGAHGEFEAKATLINHLPHELRAPALKAAATALGVNRVCYGISVAAANRMTPKQVRDDGRELLKLSGHDIPLTLIGARR